jgi:mono/diheme cytochrome c family protein
MPAPVHGRGVSDTPGRSARHCSGTVVATALGNGLALAVAASGCGPSSPGRDERIAYLDDAAFRRAELEASVVNPANGYSALRLAHYSTGASGDWDALDEWNPSVDPIASGELDAPGGAETPTFVSNGAALPIAQVNPTDEASLVALGRTAFSRYPVQLAPSMAVALASRASAEAYGLWVDPARGVGGLVRARMADGSSAIGLTCSTCHGGLAGGSVQDGLPNSNLDYGRALLDGQGSFAPAVALAIGAWGAGRLDVTTDTGTEPVAIPDLRPVRWLTFLHRDATLAVRGRTTLATRIETLIIVSHGQTIRPPRLIALALAAYVESLADALPAASTAASASPVGAAIFESRCTGCHESNALTGPPVPLAVIGTDPTLGLSEDRGTGAYRVPSLHGVGSRGPLLHTGTVPSLAAMFDPARTTAPYPLALHGASSVSGHTAGLDLNPSDRAALVTYLQAL